VLSLLQEEGRLTEQISEAQRKVEELEKHLEDLASNIGGSENFAGSPEEEAVGEFDEEELEETTGREESVDLSLGFCSWNLRSRLTLRRRLYCWLLC